VDREPPNLAKPRAEIVLPSCNASTTESLNVDPNVNEPVTDNDEPRRVTERIDKHEPKLTQSKTERLPPNLAKDRTETLLPI
jgi:hypothetical protein